MIQRRFLQLFPLIACAVPAIAQRDILPYLPESTLFAVSVPDLKSSVAEFQRMPLAKMWAEKDVQSFFADSKKLLNEQIEAGLAQAREMYAQGAIPLDPDGLLDLQVGSAALALTKCSVVMGDQGPIAEIGVVLHVDFGTAGAQWNMLLDAGQQELEKRAGEALVRSESKVGKIQVTSYAGPADLQESPMALRIARLENGVLIATLAADVQSILTNLSENKPALGAAADFVAAVEKVGSKGAESIAYFHPGLALNAFTGLLDFGALVVPELAELDIDGVERALVALGARKLGAMAIASSYGDGTCTTKGFMVRQTEPQTAAPQTIDRSLLKYVPKLAATVAAQRLDAMRMHDSLHAALAAYSPKLAETARAHLGQFEQQLGFQLKDDLFGALGNHVLYWTMPMASLGAMPEVGVLVAVQDEQRVLKVLRSMVAMSGGKLALEENEKRGFKSYQLQIQLPEDVDEAVSSLGNFNPMATFTPTFSFKNGYLVAAFSGADVKRACARLDREDDPKTDIRTNKEFAAVWQTVPEQVSGFSFTDYKTQFESLYTIFAGTVGVIPLPPEVPFDLGMMPEASVLSQHLSGGISYSTEEATGTRFVAVTPFGPELVFGLGALLAAAVVIPNVQQVRGGR